MRKQLLRRLASSRDGSVILETALMITILLMLMFGIVDLGRVLFTENQLVSAAREGARIGAIGNNPPDTMAIKDTVIGRFRPNPLGGAVLTRANIAATPQPVGAGCCTSIRVTVAYRFTWITPIRSLVGAMRDSLHAQAEFRLEQ
jgi:Flp pilus assembly protein TadG